MTTAAGRPINVAPLADALPEEHRGADLFVPQRLPGGKQVMRLNPVLAKEIASPQGQERLRKVGGVSLEVTLQLLSYAGVPEFRKPGPATVVESPVLISLAALYEKAGRFAASANTWDDLPPELRYPGDVERVYGFVLDPRAGDVFLVGAAAQSPANRLDIDSIILALRSVWSAGEVPAVSLDPKPGRSDGPQFCYVHGVPANSVFAKIMLDADYAMKRIIMGELNVGVPRFWELSKMFCTRPGQHSSRIWLEPLPLAANDIHLSPSYRCALFDSGVRSLTEAMNDTSQFVGRPDEIGEQEAIVHGAIPSAGAIDSGRASRDLRAAAWSDRLGDGRQTAARSEHFVSDPEGGQQAAGAPFAGQGGCAFLLSRAEGLLCQR